MQLEKVIHKLSYHCYLLFPPKFLIRTYLFCTHVRFLILICLFRDLIIMSGNNFGAKGAEVLAPALGRLEDLSTLYLHSKLCTE